jgi:hypothetical protein
LGLTALHEGRHSGRSSTTLLLLLLHLLLHLGVLSVAGGVTLDSLLLCLLNLLVLGVDPRVEFALGRSLWG